MQTESIAKKKTNFIQLCSLSEQGMVKACQDGMRLVAFGAELHSFNCPRFLSFSS